MSEIYKTHSDGLYFITFSVMGWVDVFTRRPYQEILIDSIHHCQQHKNLKIYCYCIMPSHIHFISYSENGSLSSVLRDFKSFTARQLLHSIAENPQESRKDWMLRLFRFYGKQSAQKQQFQFWKHDNHPFFLYTNKMIQQKINYIHENPIEAGFVSKITEWRLSSANDEGSVRLSEPIRF